MTATSHVARGCRRAAPSAPPTTRRRERGPRRRGRPRRPSAAPSAATARPTSRSGAAQPHVRPPRAPAARPPPRRGRRGRVASSVPRCSRTRSRARSIDALALPARRTGDGELERVVAEADAHSTPGASSRASQQLLDDAVGRQLDGGGQHPRVALDGQPRVAPLARTSSASRCVSVGCGAVGASEASSRRTPTTARISSSVRRLSRSMSASVAVAPAASPVAGAVVGHARQLAEAALEQLVELARQARPVGRDLQPRALVARLAQLGRARLELARHPPARADDPADAPHAPRSRPMKKAVVTGSKLDADVERASAPGRAPARCSASRPSSCAPAVKAKRNAVGQDHAAADQVGADQQLVEERGRRTRPPPRRAAPTRRHSSGTVTSRKSGTANSTGRIPPAARPRPRSSSFAGSPTCSRTSAARRAR